MKSEINLNKLIMHVISKHYLDDLANPKHEDVKKVEFNDNKAEITLKDGRAFEFTVRQLIN